MTLQYRLRHCQSDTLTTTDGYLRFFLPYRRPIHGTLGGILHHYMLDLVNQYGGGIHTTRNYPVRGQTGLPPVVGRTHPVVGEFVQAATSARCARKPSPNLRI